MFPNYQPPSFRVLPLEEEGLFQVDYYSKRRGFFPSSRACFRGSPFISKKLSKSSMFQMIATPSVQADDDRIGK